MPLIYAFEIGEPIEAVVTYLGVLTGLTIKPDASTGRIVFTNLDDTSQTSNQTNPAVGDHTMTISANNEAAGGVLDIPITYDADKLEWKLVGPVDLSSLNVAAGAELIFRVMFTHKTGGVSFGGYLSSGAGFSDPVRVYLDPILPRPTVPVSHIIYPVNALPGGTDSMTNGAMTSATMYGGLIIGLDGYRTFTTAADTAVQISLNDPGVTVEVIVAAAASDAGRTLSIQAVGPINLTSNGVTWSSGAIDLSSIKAEGYTLAYFFLTIRKPSPDGPDMTISGWLGQDGRTPVFRDMSSYIPKAMATGGLYFDYKFVATAGQTLSFEVLGELGVSAIAFDESIIIEVPKEQMSKVLGYRTNWLLGTPGATGTTGFVGETYYQPQPAVVLALQTVLGPWLDSLSAGLTGTTAGTTFVSDAENKIAGDRGSECESLVLNFQNIAGFTYHDSAAVDPALQTDYLAQIPQEAIASYALSPIAAAPLSTVVGDLVVVPAAGATMAEAGVSGAVQSLFEQAVAAGMIQAGNTLTAELNEDVLTSTSASYGAALAADSKKVYGAQFEAEQSLTIYVEYSLTKSREYRLQAAVPTGATAAPEVVFGGVTFALPTAMVETSTPVTQTYQINLVAV